VRWGVVATGKIAGVVTAQLALLEDARLQAVSSRDPARAAAFASRFGFSNSYGDGPDRTGYEALALDPEVDVVYVATPHGQHHAVARALLQAGKHVLIEKAFTINAQEARDLADLADRHGVFLMEAVWTRFLPCYHRVLDVVESGAIGDVVYVQADLGFMAASDPRDRLWDPRDGGGALLDLAVYPLSWVLGLLGDPTAVVASGRLNRDGVDELTTISLTHAGGAYAQVVASFVSQSVNRAAIVGTKGVIVTDSPVSRAQGFTLTVDGESRHEAVPHGTEPYTYQLREVTRCVQRGLRESPTMPVAATIVTMELFDEVRRQTGVTYPNDYPEE
jgi:predicted dehydrogenase